ncbi:hypothetical protein NPIL_130741 [Nephila pilipes]|uniref:Uncharacterized protein n=1 Tax=Nephila pilipes TaxID=299642 RepID=A0A8X6N1A1_NEPPI|nr:hypothetical protein NPIL_130741 [Nephila pilipes]
MRRQDTVKITDEEGFLFKSGRKSYSEESFVCVLNFGGSASPCLSQPLLSYRVDSAAFPSYIKVLKGLNGKGGESSSIFRQWEEAQNGKLYTGYKALEETYVFLPFCSTNLFSNVERDFYFKISLALGVLQ